MNNWNGKVMEKAQRYHVFIIKDLGIIWNRQRYQKFTFLRRIEKG